jgi:hypothetical protein
METPKVIIPLEEYQKLQETIKEQDEIIKTFKKGENVVFYIHNGKEIYHSTGRALYAKEVICNPKEQEKFMKTQIGDMQKDFVETLNAYKTRIKHLEDKNQDLLEYKNRPWYKKLF